PLTKNGPIWSTHTFNVYASFKQYKNGLEWDKDMIS
ncbi:unnamed protein product, partial [Onchocerca ochengi]